MLPSFDEVRETIRRPKPPLAARVLLLQGERIRRVASVIFDGLEGWWIDDGERVELRPADDRVVFVDDGRVERLGPGLGEVAANDWAKVAIDGRRMANLEHARGVVLRGEQVEDRWGWVVEALGLDATGDAPLRLHVDGQTGIILRAGRVGGADLLRVEDVRIGTVHGPR